MSSAHKYARIESERCFLLRTLPADLDLQTANRIIDRYWPGTRMRLRRIETLDGEVIQLKLTQKYAEPGHSPEETIITNQYLNQTEFDLFAQLTGVELIKRRYRYLHRSSGYSIDRFEGHLEGLLLAEIEAGQGVLAPGSVPDFAVYEVTAEPAFTGGVLVTTDAVQLAELLAKWLGGG
jgi:CYTH domain-containing protein